MTEESRKSWWVAPAIASALTTGNVTLWLIARAVNIRSCAPYADANGRDMKVGHLTLSLVASVIGLVVLGCWWKAARRSRNVSESGGRRDLLWWSVPAICLLLTLWTLRAVVDDPYC